MDYYRCKWPPHLSQRDDTVAAYMDGLNDTYSPVGALAEEIAALRAAHPNTPVISFSHFVPRLSLNPEKRFLFNPALAKACGSSWLRRRVDQLRPDMHIFGHTHFGWDATIDDIRYVHA